MPTHELSALLKDDAWAILKELRYVRPTNTPARLKAVEREAEKKAIETARYVIPLGGLHVDGAHGLGPRAASPAPDAERRRHALRSADGHRRHGRSGQRRDPMFFEKVGLETLGSDACPRRLFRGPAPPATPSPPTSIAGSAAASRACATGPPDAESVVADAVRATFGLTAAEMDDDEAIDRVMNPARNLYRVDMLNVSYHSPMMRALHHASYVFEKRLSHTADSQDQRHRMVPASRPMMTFADTAAPDYVTPRLIRQNPAALAVYDAAMDDAWTAKNRLLALGVPLEFALYLLPNAKALRLVESGIVHRASAQVDAAHVLQRSGGDLSRLDGRNRAGPRRPSAAGAVPWPAVCPAQPHRLAALHRRDALLRRAGLEQLPARRTAS